MSFGLTPREHLDFLKAERRGLWEDRTSIRKGINCCVWANHLPEIVFAVHGANDPVKVYSQTSPSLYRAHLTAVRPEMGIIRDLCDYAKHGPKLGRSSVQVDKIEARETLQMNWFIIVHHDRVD